MKHSKASEYKIKKIMKHFCVDIDATKTSELIEINRNTINRFYHLFRQAIYQHQMKEFGRMIGEVEVDESYHRAKRKRGFHRKSKPGRGTNKQPVFRIFKRGGRIYTEIVPDCKKATLQKIIRQQVGLESEIFSDGWRGCDGLVDVGYDKHFPVHHGKNEFSKGRGVHINGIENFWSFVRRRLNKFNGYKAHFEFHLKECEWRYGKSSRQLQDELIIIFKAFLKSKNLLV